jgi:hypothetical protein
MKVSQLCSLIQESIRSGRYPLDTDTQKKFAGSVLVTNVPSSQDAVLDGAEKVAVEVRVDDLYVVNGYVPNILHLPGIIEADVLDSFKMICRRIERLDSGMQIRR